MLESPKVGLFYGLAFFIAGLAPRSDVRLLFPVALLVAAGLSAIHQIAPTLALQQARWLIIAVAAFVVAANPRMVKLWEAHALPLTVLAVAFMLVTAFIGMLAASGRSSLDEEAFLFYPVEIAKIQLIMFWGSVMSRWNVNSQPNAPSQAGSGGEAQEVPHDVRWAFALTSLFVLCTLWQRDFGPLLVLSFAGTIWSLSRGGIHWRSFAVQLVGMIFLALTGVVMFGHIQTRFIAWLRPWDDPYGFGYQSIQSLFAIARGGIFGSGWGNLAATALPAAVTDLPLIVLAEAVGAGGVLLVLVGYAWLIERMLRLSRQQPKRTRRQIALGLSILLISQVLLILAGSVRLLPLTGITLPLVSYGGSSLVATFLIFGYISSGESALQSSSYGFRLNTAPLLRGAVVGLTAVFLALVYWGVIQGPELKAHPLHTSVRGTTGQAARAGITTRSGESLNSTSGNNNHAGSEFRYLAHIVGYRHPLYGLAGLEAVFDSQLSGRRALHSTLGERLHFGRPQQVHTTIDARVQAAIEAAWRPADRGAVVALDPWTGEILGMLSSPTFSSERLRESMEASATEAPMFNRALQGLYPPGSTWKLIVLAAALEAGAVDPQTVLQDAPTAIIDGTVIRNAGGRSMGALHLTEALAFSSNVIFARLATQTGSQALRTMAQAMGVGAEFGLPLPTAKGSTGRLETQAALAAAGIGQGEVLVTPLEMAVAAAAIANGGFYVEPRIVLEPADVRAGGEAGPQRIMSSKTVALLQQGMRAATAYGTASGAADATLLAGKTGTAENPHGAPHSWFVGFAPASQPSLALVVLVENGGSGAHGAAPIADAIVKSLFGTADSLPVH